MTTRLFSVDFSVCLQSEDEIEKIYQELKLYAEERGLPEPEMSCEEVPG